MLLPRYLSITILSLLASFTTAQLVVQDVQHHLMSDLLYSKQDNPAPGSTEAVLLSDVLHSNTNINVFGGFLRDIEEVASRIANEGQNTTILAPLNKNIMSLPQKPWEDPEQYDEFGADAYEGSDGEQRARQNLENFVQRHIITISPFPEGEKIKTLKGNEVWWETKDGHRTVRCSDDHANLQIQPGNIEVDTVANTVKNGQIWIIKGVIAA